jgi:hypothetical protein
VLVLWHAYQMLFLANLKKLVQVGIPKFYRVSVSSPSNNSPWVSIIIIECHQGYKGGQTSTSSNPGCTTPITYDVSAVAILGFVRS